MEQSEVFIGVRELSPEQRRVVREVLKSVLDSDHFRKSSRYPALLDFAVCNTLDGNFDLLKERVIGSKVFGRPPDYDTSNDAIVRIAAREVRKRMALYFSENPNSPIRIDLQDRSYIAEFHFRQPASIVADIAEPRSDAATVQASSDAVAPLAKNGRRRMQIAGAGTILIALLVGIGVLAWNRFRDKEKPDLWWPVLHNDVPALIVLGENRGPSRTEGSMTSTNAADASHLVMGNAIAAVKICNIFRKFGRDCNAVPAQSANLDDLRKKSVVLIGALDNTWTLRLMAPLRYQFQFDTSPSTSPEAPAARLIVDKIHPESTSKWAVGPNGPQQEFGNEYAIIGRFFSEMTDGTVIVLAGVGPAGTSGAAEYAVSRETLHEILSLAPKDWKGFNFEAVLQIGVVQGNPGHVKVVATQFW